VSDKPAGSAAPTFGRFFLPGPTEVLPEVLEAQTKPMIGHRGKGVQDLIGRLEDGLKALFKTERPVIISTSSATGLMEAAARNGVRRRALSLVAGAFSERFAEIVESCGFEVERLEMPWGRPHDPEAVRARLASGGFDAVTVVHSETSTGALQPLEQIAEVVRSFDDVVLLVDGVTSVAGAPVHTDRWGLDFVLTGSQKALALPPGLAFAVPSERIMERSRTATRKGVYFDLVSFMDNLSKNQTPNTPAVSLFYALEVQLRRIMASGVEARWDNHRKMAERCWAWVETMRDDRGIPIEVLAPEGYRSPTVTCIKLPSGVKGPDVVAAVKAKGWVIGGGYGKMKDTSIRIGHMGDHTVQGVEGVLGVVEETFVSMGLARATQGVL
jgi:predicted phosphoserine aminotransferase